MGGRPNQGPSTSQSSESAPNLTRRGLQSDSPRLKIMPMRAKDHAEGMNLTNLDGCVPGISQQSNDDGCRAGATGHGLQALFPSTHAGHPLPALSRPCLPHPSSPSSDPSSGSRVVSWQVPRLPRRRETGRCRVQSLGDEMNRATTRLAPRRRRVKNGYVRHLEGQVRYLSAKLREIASDIHAGAHPMAIADKADEAIEAFEFAAPKAGGQ